MGQIKNNTTELQEILAAVNALPNAGITPSGTLKITENGTYDVTNYASAKVDIASDYIPNLEDVTITENGTYSPSSGYDGIGNVTVNVESGTSVETCTITISNTSNYPMEAKTVKLVDGAMQIETIAIGDSTNTSIENIVKNTVMSIFGGGSQTFGDLIIDADVAATYYDNTVMIVNVIENGAITFYEDGSADTGD